MRRTRASDRILMPAGTVYLSMSRSHQGPAWRIFDVRDGNCLGCMTSTDGAPGCDQFGVERGDWDWPDRGQHPPRCPVELPSNIGKMVMTKTAGALPDRSFVGRLITSSKLSFVTFRERHRAEVVGLVQLDTLPSSSMIPSRASIMSFGFNFLPDLVLFVVGMIETGYRAGLHWLAGLARPVMQFR